MFSYLVNKANSTNDTPLLFTVFRIEVSIVYSGPRASWKARVSIKLSVESSTAVSNLLRLVQVENAESKWPSPHNQMILFNWSGSRPWTTNVSFVVCSVEL